MGSGQKCEVFIEYEAEVSSRVCGVKRGVVDFSKLFTKTTVAAARALDFALPYNMRPWPMACCPVALLLLLLLLTCEGVSNIIIDSV